VLLKHFADKYQADTLTATFSGKEVNIIKNASESIDHDGEIYIRTSHNPVCLEIADTGNNTCSKRELSRLTIGETGSSSITIRIFLFRQTVSIKRLHEKTTVFSGCALTCGSGMRTTSAKFVIK